MRPALVGGMRGPRRAGARSRPARGALPVRTRRRRAGRIRPAAPSRQAGPRRPADERVAAMTTSRLDRVVIVGGVAGGMSAATRLRRLDESVEIVVIER